MNLYDFLKHITSPNTKHPVVSDVTDKNRLRFVILCILVGFMVLSMRLATISLSNFAPTANTYQGSNYLEDMNYKRGDILDRNGRIIATDVDTNALYANARLIENPSEIALQISNIVTDLNFNYVYKRLISSKKNKQILIKRNVTPAQKQDVQKLGIAGIFFGADTARIYPNANLFAHIVGYTDVDRNGISGLEKQYDDRLKDKTMMEEGYRLKTTLDTRVQGILHGELADGVKKFKAKGGCGIVMNVNNGEILGIANLPDFNPNRTSTAKTGNKFNQATYGVYEMGSVFKIFTLASALEEGEISFDKIYNVADPIKYGKFKIKDIMALCHHYSADV